MIILVIVATVLLYACYNIMYSNNLDISQNTLFVAHDQNMSTDTIRVETRGNATLRPGIVHPRTTTGDVLVK